MPAKRSGSKTTSASLHDAGAVDEFMRGLDHPLKPALAMVRSIILAADSNIAEAIKWNSPSFHVKEYFATINVNTRNKPADCVLVVFHKGAKVKDNSTRELVISDPNGLLEWMAEERCVAKFYDVKEVKAKKSALQDIVRQWIAQM